MKTIDALCSPCRLLRRRRRAGQRSRQQRVLAAAGPQLPLSLYTQRGPRAVPAGPGSCPNERPCSPLCEPAMPSNTHHLAVNSTPQQRDTAMRTIIAGLLPPSSHRALRCKCRSRAPL